MKNQFSFLDAESIALKLAYAQFFGEKQPVGIAFTFITDRKNGNPWSDKEKEEAKYISRTAILDLKKKNLTKMIQDGLIPDCAMARRFMATGSGMTSQGYCF